MRKSILNQQDFYKNTHSLLNKNKLSEVTVCLVMVLLLLLIFFPQFNIFLLILLDVIIVLSILFLRARIALRVKKFIDFKKRYKIEKRIIVFVDGVLYAFAICSIVVGIWGYLAEQDRDIFSLSAMGIIVFLGLICLYFGILISVFILRVFSSFEAYKRYSINEEYD